MLGRHPSFIRIAALALVCSSACGGGSSSGYPTGSGGQNPPPSGQPPSNTTSAIKVENNRFSPATTTVAVGTTVTWTWDACSDDGYGGQSCIGHNVTFDAGGGSATLQRGSYQRQFNTAGTFNYHCTEHGGAMTGQVVVR